MNCRSADGTFTTGNAGRPKGARNKATQAVLALLEGEGEALTRKAIEMALAGDGAALRLCLDRIAPPRLRPLERERGISIKRERSGLAAPRAPPQRPPRARLLAAVDRKALRPLRLCALVIGAREGG